MLHRKLAGVDVEGVNIGTGVSRQILIGPEEAPHFSMRCFAIAPGGAMPMHTNTVEHEQFILGGRAEVSVDGKVFEVEENDVVLIPEGVPHYYKTLGDEPFRFLCLIPNREDLVDILE